VLVQGLGLGLGLAVPAEVKEAVERRHRAGIGRPGMAEQAQPLRFGLQLARQTRAGLPGLGAV
jgi:hypothetical protein